MCVKVFVMLALMASVSIEFAYSLKCATCYDVDSCKRPENVECNAKSTHITRNVLALHYTDVRYLSNTDFSCFGSSYGLNNVTLVDLRGCIMKGTVDCLSNYADSIKERSSCTVCQRDLCNSVAKISSSLITLIPLLALTKILGM